MRISRGAALARLPLVEIRDHGATGRGECFSVSWNMTGDKAHSQIGSLAENQVSGGKHLLFHRQFAHD